MVPRRPWEARVLGDICLLNYVGPPCPHERRPTTFDGYPSRPTVARPVSAIRRQAANASAHVRALIGLFTLLLFISGRPVRSF